MTRRFLAALTCLLCDHRWRFLAMVNGHVREECHRCGAHRWRS